jgi:hypothetical protein
MFSLLLSTFEMMAITFLIGFVVAAVIKSIAICADSLELHHSSSSEMKAYGRFERLRMKIAEIMEVNVPLDRTEKLVRDERQDYVKGINKDVDEMDEAVEDATHGVSRGISKFDLMDFYYPRDTRLIFLKRKRAMMKKKPGSPEDENASSNENEPK